MISTSATYGSRFVIAAALVAALFMSVSIVFAEEAPVEPVAVFASPELTTDKADYAPGETAIIFGRFFQSLQNIILVLIGTLEDGTQTTDSWTVSAGGDGSFTTNRILNSAYTPTYLLVANSETGELLAQTSFTDAVGFQGLSFTVGQIPNPVIQGNNATYTVTGDFNGGGSTGCSATLSVTSILPTDVVVGFATNPMNSNGADVNSIVTMTTTGATPVGSHTIAIKAVAPTVSGGQGCNGATQHATTTLIVTSSIVKTNPTLSVSNSPQTYSGSPIAAVVTSPVAGTASDVKYDGSSTVPTNAGTYAITADFLPTDTVNYNNLSDAPAGNFSITPADADCSSIVGYTDDYDALAHGAGGSCVGVGPDAVPSGLTLGASYTDVPGGMANWNFVNPNYNSQNGSVSIDISKATLTATADDQTITYGDADPAHTFAYSGFVGGETSAVVDTAPTCDVAGAHANAGTYSIDCSGGAANNYDFGYVSGTLTISKATLTVTANNQVILATQNEPNPYTFTYSGFKYGETDAVLGTKPTCDVPGPNTAGGVYPIVCDGGVDENYAFSYVNGSLVIIAAQPPITITKKEFQNGSTIPVKIPSPISGWNVRLLVCSGDSPTLCTTPTPAVSSGGSNFENQFRFDAPSQYIYNLSTKNTSIFKTFGVGTYSLWIEIPGVITGHFKLGTIKIK